MLMVIWDERQLKQWGGVACVHACLAQELLGDIPQSVGLTLRDGVTLVAERVVCLWEVVARLSGRL